MNEENIIGDVDIFAHQKAAESAPDEVKAPDSLDSVDIFAHQTEGRRIAAKALAEGDANKAANLRSMSERFGENRTVSELEIDFLNTTATTEDYLNKLGVVPAVATWMSENPKDAPIFKNDIERFQNVQRVIPKGGIGSWVYAFSLGLSSGLADVDYGNLMYRLIENPELVNDEAFKLDQDRLKKASEKYAQDTYDHKYVQTAGQFLGMMGGSVAQGAEEAKLMGSLGLAYGLAGGPVTASTLVGAMGVAGMTGGMYKTEAGMTMATLLELGVPMEKARSIAVGVGGLNAAIELLGGAAAIKAASPAFKALSPSVQRFIQRNVLSSEIGALEQMTLGNFAKKATVGGIGSASSEAGTEMLQEGVNIVGEEVGKVWGETGKPAITTNEALERVAGVGEETFGGAGVLYMLGLGALLPFNLSRIHRAQQTKELFDTIGAEVGQMEGAKLSPSATKEVVDAMTEDAGIGTVYIDGVAFAQSMRKTGVTIDEVREIAPEVADQIEQASVSGSDVTMTTGDFAAKFSQTQLGQELTNHVRLSESDISPAEGKSLETQVQEMRQAMEAKSDQTEDDAEDAKASAVKAEIRSIREQAFEALKAAGFSTVESRAQATLGERILRSFATVAGLDAAGVRRFAPTVVNRVKSTKDIMQAVGSSIDGYNLSRAKDMHAAGATAQDIADRTGWVRVGDGAWRRVTVNDPVFETQQDRDIAAREASYLTKGGEGREFKQVRTRPEPKKTVYAYKLFRTKNGKLYPLFVSATQEVPVGVWLDAEVGPMTDKGKVKSKLGPLHFRPGWHAGDLPIATHIGGKSAKDLKKPDYRPDDQVWALVEMAADKDWQTEANRRGVNAKGKFIAANAEINDQIPEDGYYRYKTNPNMTGNWLIGGSMKVVRVLSDDEVKAVNDKAGVADLPRLNALNASYQQAASGKQITGRGQDGAFLEEQKKWLKWRPAVTSTGRILGAPHWFTSNRQFPALVRRLIGFVNEGEIGRFWYEDSAEFVLAMVGGNVKEAERLIQLIAIYSPQMKIGANLMLAIRAYTHWKMGLPEKSLKLKTKSQDDKARGVLYHNKSWGGRKTNTFYQNLMYAIATRHEQACREAGIDVEDILRGQSTIDMWMKRAFGYSSDVTADDKGSGQYAFCENTLRRVTAVLNKGLKPGEEPWTPHQVQAAIWTGIMARYEIVKDDTDKEFQKIGLSELAPVTDKNGNPKKLKDGSVRMKFVRKSDAESVRKQMILWNKNAMGVETEKAKEWANTYARSYATEFERMVQQVPWDILPPLGTHGSSFLRNASPFVQKMFAEDVASIFVDGDGENVLRKKLGVNLGDEGDVLGLDGDEPPQNLISRLLNIWWGEEGVPSKDAVRKFSLVLQYVCKQEHVPFFRIENRPPWIEQNVFRVFGPDGKKIGRNFKTMADAKAAIEKKCKTNEALKREDFSIKGGSLSRYYAIRFAEPITTGAAGNALGKIKSSLGNGYRLTQIDETTAIVINYRNESGVPVRLEDEDFVRLLDGIDFVGATEKTIGWLDADYGHVQDWEQDPDGKGILDLLGIKDESKGNDAGGLRTSGEVDAPISRNDLGRWRNEYDRVLQKYTPEYIARLELANRGIQGPYRRWENRDAEVHRRVAKDIRDDIARNGIQDYRKTYGRAVGAAMASQAVRALGATYRRADQRSGGTWASVVWRPDETLSAVYAKNGISTPAFYEFDGGEENAKIFQEAIQASKTGPNSAAVYVYPVEEYAQMRLFLTEDRTAGFAIKKTGDIVSVFKIKGSPHSGVVQSILANATAAGGNHMDCFDTVLPMFYSAWGYRVVARQKWNDEYAPEGWNKEDFKAYNNGEPDVCYLALDPEYYGMYQGTEGEIVDDYDEVLSLQKEAYTELAKASQKKADAGGEGAFAQTAYHGSPHVFDEFTLDHIGTGEGAQVHGWGLYFALDKGIAEGYRERLTGDSPEEWLYKRMDSYVEEKKSALGLRLYGNELADLYERLAERDPSLSPDELGGMTVEQARAKLGNPSDRELSMQAEAIRFAFDEMDNPRSYDEFVENLTELETTNPDFRKYVESDVLKGEKYQQTEGMLYTVDIPEDNVMIREDAPFKDQPEAVQKAAMKLIAGSKGTKLLDDYFAKIFKANPLARKVFPDLKKYLDNHAKTVRARAIKEGDYFDKEEQDEFVAGLKSAISKEGKMPKGVDPAEWDAAKASVLQLLADPVYVHLAIGYSVVKDLDTLGELMQMDGRDILKEVEWKKRSPKAAAEAFRKEGVLGVRYRGRVDGECAVVWSEEAVKMREMLEAGMDGEGVRGYFNPATNRISLTPDADLSTFAHEMAHWYLENIFVAAKLPTATESLKRDVEAMLKDFGLNSIDEWEALDFDAKSKLHERFAYQFERYLAEGKAPSKQTEGFFRRIGKWIRDVYRAWTGGAPEALDETYKKLFGENLPELSDEVRRVMDRMLESEDQVNAAVQAESLMPLFAQKPESMTDAEWAEYQASIDDSTSEAVEALTKVRSSDERWHIRARSKALKEIQKKGKEVRDKIRERVARRVNNLPEALAIDILKSGGKVMGVANLKIDPSTLTWLNAAQIDNLRSMGLLKKGGVHVRTARSMLAPMARFSSDKQMIDRILAFKDRDEVIEEQTTQEAMRTHSELFDPKKVDEAVTAAVHNEARERMLGHELKALLGEGRSRVYIAAAKKAADELLARTPLRLATVRHFLAAESRAAKRAEDAMKAGNLQEAAMYKRQQLVQHNAARAVVGAQEMARRMKKHESLIFRKDAKLAKSYDTNILAVARAVLANNGFGPANVQPGEAYLEKVRKYDPQIVLGLQAFLDRHPFRPDADTRDMTIAELLRVYEDVDNLVALARAAKNVTLDGKSRDIAEVVDEMLLQIAKLGKTPYRPGMKRAATRRESLRKLYMSGRAMLTRVETWCVEMDGGEADGVFTRNIFRPVANAAAKYRNANIEYQKRLKDMLDPMWKKWDSQGEIEAPELGYVFERKAELIGALLHIGNESNKEKLLIGGRGEGASWADVRELEDGTQNVSYARWDAFLARCFQEGIVTKEDMDFVQSVWDLLEETKGMSQRAFRDYYGFYFEEVDASPVVTPFGVYRGGYVPAATDPVLTAGRDKQLERDLFESESEFFDMMPVRQPGWSKSRVIKYNKPLQLNVGMIGIHLNSVVKFAHMANPVKNVQRVINNRKLKDAIDNYDPQVIPDMLSPWLRRSATQTVGEPSNGFGRILNKLRGLSGMSLMAANLSNALQQYTGLSIAANLIGAKQSAIGLGQYIASPKKARDRVSVASEFMRARLNDMAFEFQSQIERMASDRVPTTAEKVRDWTTRHAYFLQTFAQRTVDIPVWLGAYDKGVKDGMSDEDAVQYADSVVRRTQGSFDPESVAKVETGSPVFRSLLVFYNYFNMQLNLVHQRYAERMANKEYGRFAMDMFAIVALPAVMSEVIAQAFGGFDAGDDDDWDAFDALALVISSINKNLVAMIPFIGNWINVGGTKIAKSGDNAVSDVAKLLFGSNTYNDRLLSVPVASLIENSWQAVPSTIRALEGDGSARAAARNSLDAVTLITGIPVSGLKKPVGYAAGVAAGEIEPESPADVVRGLVSGKDVNK